MSSDVVVLGLGAAGLAAAIRAEELGAKVTVLERQPSNAHTPGLRMSGGMVMVTSGDEATPYLDACAGSLVPTAVNRAWAVRAARLPAWLGKVAEGLAFTRCAGAEHADLPGAGAVWVLQPGESAARLDPLGGAGRALYMHLRRTVESRANIEVRWGTRAVRLLREGTHIAGVSTDSSDSVASTAVILSTGGFEFDDEAKHTYLGAHQTYFYGNPGNVGDGLRMARAIGADLWHMSSVGGRGVIAFETGKGTMQAFHTRIAPPGYVITDQNGLRYADEESQARQDHTFYNRMLEFDVVRNRYPRVPSYWFFDRRRLSAAPLATIHIGAIAVGLASWSDDNRAEIEKGWIACGDSISDAARAAGMEDPEQAEVTVREYNSGCLAGRDAFGRPSASLVPLDSPPYCCVKLWPGGSNTAGGPRRDESARVLDVDGDPIPGLFAAGSLGQAVGAVYPAAGANLSEAFCFGQVAAESALRADGR